MQNVDNKGQLVCDWKIVPVSMRSWVCNIKMSRCKFTLHFHNIHSWYKCALTNDTLVSCATNLVAQQRHCRQKIFRTMPFFVLETLFYLMIQLFCSFCHQNIYICQNIFMTMPFFVSERFFYLTITTFLFFFVTKFTPGYISDYPSLLRLQSKRKLLQRCIEFYDRIDRKFYYRT